MKIVVPGASGFFGRNLLLQAPGDWDILAVYNRQVDFPEFVERRGLKNVTPLKLDLTDADATERSLDQLGPFDAAVFLAANGNPTLSLADPAGDLKSTVLTFLNFIQACQPRRLVYLSSGAVYDGLKGEVSPDSSINPALPYAISHLACEQYLKAFAGRGQPAEYVILRFFGAFGPYEPSRKIYTRLVNAFYFNKSADFTIRGDGQNLIDAMFVDDAVRGILKVLVSDVKNETVDFLSGQPMTIEELVNEAARVFGRTTVSISRQGATVEPIAFRASPSGMADLFDWRPKVNLEEGLKRLAAFLEEQL